MRFVPYWTSMGCLGQRLPLPLAIQLAHDRSLPPLVIQLPLTLPLAIQLPLPLPLVFRLHLQLPLTHLMMNCSPTDDLKKLPNY